MPSSEAVPFQAPPSLAVEVTLPHRGRVQGLALRKGVTLIGLYLACFAAPGYPEMSSCCIDKCTPGNPWSQHAGRAKACNVTALLLARCFVGGQDVERSNRLCLSCCGCCSGRRLQREVHPAASHRGRGV